MQWRGELRSLMLGPVKRVRAGKITQGVSAPTYSRPLLLAPAVSLAAQESPAASSQTALQSLAQPSPRPSSPGDLSQAKHCGATRYSLSGEAPGRTRFHPSRAE